MDLAIETHDLSRRFGAFVAVDAVRFDVRAGEVFGYLGANGAGKSTTIRMLCGLLTPSGGDALVAGHRVSATSSPGDLARLRASIGYMSQKFSLYTDLTVDDNLEFFGGAYGLSGRALQARKDELYARIDLGHARKTLTRDLPGGLRQRVALAASLLHAPKIVFLDEPTAGVDPGSRRAFWRLIRELAREGTTVFVTTHYMDEAEHCARIGLMTQGKLVALDAPAALKTQWVPGRMLAIRADAAADALPALRALPGVLAAEPFGAGLHVRVDPERVRDDDVRARLPADAVVEEIAPTLEDVFLAVVAPPPEEKAA